MMKFTNIEKALLKQAGVPETEAASYLKFTNRDGSEGGLIAPDAEIDGNAYIGSEVVVRDHTKIGDSAILIGQSVFGPYAEAAGGTRVMDGARIDGTQERPAFILDSTIRNPETHVQNSEVIEGLVAEGAYVGDASRIISSEVVGAHTRALHTEMFHNAILSGGARAENARISDNALVTEDSDVRDSEVIGKGTVVRGRSFVGHGSSISRGAMLDQGSTAQGSQIHGPKAIVDYGANLDRCEINNSPVAGHRLHGERVDDYRYAKPPFVRSGDVEQVGAVTTDRIRVLR